MLAAMVKFWHRIATLGDNSLIHLAYNEVRMLPEDKNDWLNSVKFILKLIDMEHIYINGNQISCNVLFKNTLKKLNEIFKNQWCKKVNISSFKGSTKTGMLCAKSNTCSPQLPEYLTVRYSQRQKQTIAMAAGLCTPFNSKNNSKLRTYKFFKKELRAETYLKLPQFKFRKLIAKFRCSDHQLRIETGRHQKLEVSQRICDMCKSGKVENEIHFLIECGVYHDIRQTFLGSDLNRILTAAQKEYAFINILTSQDIS